MIDAYTTEEVIESGGPFCNNLLKDQVSIGLPPLRHEGRLDGRGRMGRKSFIPSDYNIVQEAHYSILQQLEIMDPFIELHMNSIRERCVSFVNNINTTLPNEEMTKIKAVDLLTRIPKSLHLLFYDFFTISYGFLNFESNL